MISFGVGALAFFIALSYNWKLQRLHPDKSMQEIKKIILSNKDPATKKLITQVIVIISVGFLQYIFAAMLIFIYQNLTES